MFKMHAVEAEHGDSFILEYGSPAKPRFVLVDGGPPGTYEHSLEKALAKIVTSKTLDLLLLSHVDNDHVIGLLDLLAALQKDIANGKKPSFKAKSMWHNSFDRTLDPDNQIRTGLANLMALAGALKVTLRNTSDVFLGVSEGYKLRTFAHRLKIALNEGFPDELITVDRAKDMAIKLGPLKLTIVGPSQANLDELRHEWLDWLADIQEKLVADPKVAANADRSVPNLSSIVVLAECEGKRVLMTGDARGDHILAGLIAAGLMKEGEKFAVDVLKVQHHGSDRNITKKFLTTVIADKYVISANGQNGNPDLDTLKWIIEAAHEANRRIEIIVTHATKSTQAIVKKYKPSAYKYKLKVRGAKAHSIAVVLA